MLSELQNIPCRHLDTSIYPKMPQQALDDYRAAVELSEPKGQPIDFKQVAALYRASAEAGYWKAMNNLAMLHLGGYGVQRSEEEALGWYRQMEKLGIPEGYLEMGGNYESGLGSIKPDMDKAVKYFAKAAEMGHPEGQTIVAIHLLHESARYHDPDAIRLLECAVEQDYAEAAWRLGIYYKVYKKHPETVKYFRRGAQLGHAYCLDQLKRAYRYGALGLNKDLKRAQCLLGLKKELRKDPTLTFPDLDQRCPGTVKQPY